MEEFETYIDQLKNGNDEDRHDAAIELGYLKDPRAFDALVEALEDSSTYVRGDAARALGEIGDKRAIVILISKLASEDAYLSCCAAEALWSFPDERAIYPLIDTLKRVEAFSKEEIESYDALYIDYWWNVLGALECIGTPAVEPLITTMLAENSGATALSAEALGLIGDLQAVEPLIHVLRTSKNSDVRYYSVRALFNIGDIRAIEPLKEALGDIDKNVRDIANQCLKKFEISDFAVEK